MRRILLAATALVALSPAAAQDRTSVNRIIDEGTNHSEVMMIAQH